MRWGDYPSANSRWRSPFPPPSSAHPALIPTHNLTMAEPDLNKTFGACYIGAMVTCILYGFTTLQTFFYFMHYSDDGWGRTSLVTAVWILDSLHVAAMGHAMYYYLVTNYGNPSALADGVWSLYLSIAFNVSIAVLVQGFFTLRIYSYTSRKLRWYLASVIMAVVVAHFAFGMETVALMFVKRELDKLSSITLFAAMPFAIFAVLSDILIAVTLCILLQGSRTDFKSTNAVVTTLTIYAINRCLLTSIVAIVEVTVFAVYPKSLWFLAIDFVIGKLYANSLLATLNTRNALRVRGLETDNTTPVRTQGGARPSDIQFTDMDPNRGGTVKTYGDNSETTETTIRRSAIDLDDEQKYR